jgi:ribonuclease P protein component
VLGRLQRRAEFLRARTGARATRGCVMIEAFAREESTGPRLGVTATRKLGSAVVRNRAKRRLREAARRVLAPQARTNVDYVLIARAGLTEASWDRLLDDLSAALLRLHAQLQGRGQSLGPSAREAAPR